MLFFDHDLGGVHQLAPSFDEFLWAYVKHLEAEPGWGQPRAWAASIAGGFTAENDHNPVYCEQCEQCEGFGKLFVVRYDKPRCVEDDLCCSVCGGTGMVQRRRFDNDEPPVKASLGPDGWLTCPKCRRRFAPYDKAAWTGYRHTSCGQRIVLR